MDNRYDLTVYVSFDNHDFKGHYENITLLQISSILLRYDDKTTTKIEIKRREDKDSENINN